jgi:exosome complex exonuclease DIS3/RRP44
MRDFVVHEFGKNHRLLDLMAITVKLDQTQPALYEEHLDSDTLLQGVRSAQFVKGILRAKNGNWEDCYVVSHDGKKRNYIDIKGVENINRALDGDIVVVKLVGSTNCSPLEQNEYRDLEGFVDESIQNNGLVVGIMKHANAVFRGSIANDQTKCIFEEKENFVLFAPVTRNAPKVWVHSHRVNDLVGKRFVVQVDSWPTSSLYPIGHCVQVLGNIGDQQVETQIVLHEYGVTSEDFSTEVMGCLPSRDWEIGEADLVGRSDFRAIPIVSIDPPGCKDIDDALHCVRLPNGHLQVGVHIAGNIKFDVKTN